MKSATQTKSSKVLIVDDEPVNLRVLKLILQDEYDLLFAKSGEEAIIIAQKSRPNIILMDVMMPGMTGFEACSRLKQIADVASIPVIFTTSLADHIHEARGFESGGVDYITKPVNADIVKARVKTHLSLVRADELKSTRLQIIQKLGRAAEYKDNETGFHVIRMSHYSKVLCEAYGFDRELAEDLFNAAPMHDIGKIGIADNILLKPGKLTDEEFAIMKTHPLIGAEIIGDSDSRLLQLARNVALHHHEKWNGTGYPYGLEGERIPVEARIVAIADVFDALTSARPYKKAWPVQDAVKYIEEQSGEHFDPELATLFVQQLDMILDIKSQWSEDAVGEKSA